MARGRISDSALKSCSYLLTVCRCQRTSQGLVSGPAVGLISGFSVRHSNSKRSCLLSLLPRMGPMGIMRIMGLIFPLPRFLVLFLHPTVGVTGLEPVTLRLSSACSNQLSYTPVGWPWVFGSASAGPASGARQWRHGDSNPRPIACKATALPTELCPLGVRDSASPGLSPCGGIFLGS